VKKEGAPTGQKKKSEYRGVKVDGIKKAKKPKKKSNDQQTALAKKIAPKQKHFILDVVFDWELFQSLVDSCFCQNPLYLINLF